MVTLGSPVSGAQMHLGDSSMANASTEWRTSKATTGSSHSTLGKKPRRMGCDNSRQAVTRSQARKSSQPTESTHPSPIRTPRNS